jgi:hypothetical protein
MLSQRENHTATPANMHDTASTQNTKRAIRLRRLAALRDGLCESVSG